MSLRLCELNGTGIKHLPCRCHVTALEGEESLYLVTANYWHTKLISVVWIKASGCFLSKCKQHGTLVSHAARDRSDLVVVSVAVTFNC
jgi:hypothetical protein